MAYTYARRKALALQKFGADPAGKVNPYTYYRRVSEYVRDTPLFTEETGVDTAKEDFDAARTFYEAFERGDEGDYSIHVDKAGNIVVTYDENGKPHGAKAKLLIDIFGYVTDASAWREHYSTGTRFGHLLPQGTVKRKAQRPRKKPKKRTVRRRKR
jgi:alkyl sulfatase BDS1-like metallo-beta-lactamase superfamily hydrolase